MAKTMKKVAKVARNIGRASVTKSKPKRGTAGDKAAVATKNATSRSPSISPDILAYNAAQLSGDRAICDVLAAEIQRGLPNAENKIWHRHPVWFLDGNPIAGYSKLKDCIRLLFWSGQSFDEPGLADEGSFKAAEARYTAADQIAVKDLKRWLAKGIAIQWDYKNIVKRKGRLERLK